MALVDRSLTHQPILTDGRGQGMNYPLLSCNCRYRVGMGPIAEVPELADTVREYNDPDNHVEPFGEEWMLHGQCG